jgi:hypothetical protein
LEKIITLLEENLDSEKQKEAMEMVPNVTMRVDK